MVVLLAGAQIGTIDESRALAGHGVDGLAHAGVAGGFAAGGEAAEDGGAEGDGLVACGDVIRSSSTSA